MARIPPFGRWGDSLLRAEVIVGCIVVAVLLVLSVLYYGLRWLL